MRRATTLLQAHGRALTTASKRPTPLSSATALLRERTEAASASPLPLPQPPPTKHPRPSRVTDLYNALIYEGDSRNEASAWRPVMAISASGARAADDYSETVRQRLEGCRQASHGEAALDVLRDVERRDLLPTTRAVVMVVEACLPAEEFALAEDALLRLDRLPHGHPVASDRLVVSTRALVAVAYVTRGRYADALRVLRMPELGSVVWRDKAGVEAVLAKAMLGRDTVAWGAIVKALTKGGAPDAAVEVMDIAMARGVGMTDSLLHLTIDALRASRRWREADWLFQSAVEKGVKVSERTVASMLLALCHRDARRVISVKKVQGIVDIVPEPSERFMSSTLLVFANFGALQRAEEVFANIKRASEKQEPDIYAYAWMMNAYNNYLDVGWEEKGSEEEPAKRYEEVNTKADAHWRRYLSAHGQRRPVASQKGLRLAMLSNYLGAKTRCFKLSEAVDVLEEIAGDKHKYPWLVLTVAHFTTVLGAVELSCDVVQLRRVHEIMRSTRTRHDMRSLAFSVGTQLGNGDVPAALALVRSEAPRLFADGYVDPNFRTYHLIVLQRRLDMLTAALKESVGMVKDIEDIAALLRGRRESAARAKS